MSAFLLTWKQDGWPHENIVRMARSIELEGHVDEPWRLHAHRKANVGDRVWLLKQGRGPKGIFGTGHVIAPPRQGPAGNGQIQWMAPIRFSAFVDPLQQLLIGEDVVARVLRTTQMRSQASGDSLGDDQSEALQRAFESGSPIQVGGTGDWTPAEIAAIVADYVDMLECELEKRPYSKTQHRKLLLDVVHRSAGSIERKHENISAVLGDLSLPWIDGYKPLSNRQNALIDAIDPYVPRIISLADKTASLIPAGVYDLAQIFVAPPRSTRRRPSSEPVVRLIKKYDPALRDEANRSLGSAGEELVVRIERERLQCIGRADLSTQIDHVSQSVGDGLGYDIESFSKDGSKIFIEVKTTRGTADTPFFVTENERRVAVEKGAAYYVYRLFGFGTKPQIFKLNGVLEDHLALEPISYRARVTG